MSMAGRVSPSYKAWEEIEDCVGKGTLVKQGEEEEGDLASIVQSGGSEGSKGSVGARGVTEW